MKKLILVLAVSFFSGSLFAGGDCGASGVSITANTNINNAVIKSIDGDSQ